jgi:glycosyltransferase involved in cell wall biosynthesis
VPESSEVFPVTASVIIPVRNRVKTIADAVRSALAQQADFAFNVIVVDNHSTDGTTEALRQMAAENSRLIHLTPARTDLGIGGCWNEAVYSEHCGRYAVQLDSDDIYSGDQTLARIVVEFKSGKYAMVIGSYTIVDFDLNELPPGLIDHREWTRENGRNNALRINGLGAPRAFDVGVLRQIGLPNTSYGEDYAVALRISRQYEVGRIYDSLYFARRWSGNSDSALPLATANRYDAYKDRLRTLEILARQQFNAGR